MRKLAGAGLAVLVALSSCQLFGGVTQVRFLNSTTSFTFSVVVFGSVTVSPLPPAAQPTGYYPIVPGPDLLLAQDQASGVWTSAIQFTIAAGHSYTIVFSELTPGTLTISFTADN